MVVVALLHVVECVETLRIALLVGKVHHVPVDLTVGLGRGEVVVDIHIARYLIRGGRVVEVPHVVCRAGQLLVVVGARVGGIAVPSECRGAVLAVLHGYSSGELTVFVYIEVPSGKECRLEGVYHTGIALHAVLVAPVGIVIVRTGQGVSLLGGGTLLGTLGGHLPETEREAVVRVEDFLCAQEVTERVVEGTFDDTLVGPAVGK